MNSIIIANEPESKLESIVKWADPIDATTDLTGVPDGVFPYNGLVDQWVVIVGETAVNWSCTYGMACIQHIEAMRVKREHVTRNPSINSGHGPANGLGAWWTIRTADYTASVDRNDNGVSYEDHC